MAAIAGTRNTDSFATPVRPAGFARRKERQPALEGRPAATSADLREMVLRPRERHPPALFLKCSWHSVVIEHATK